MFGNFSLPELLIVGALALIVIGPKDLPRMMRQVGRFVGQARGLARQFQDSMNDAAREADLEEFREARKLLKGKTGGVKDMLDKTLDFEDDDEDDHKPPKPQNRIFSPEEREKRAAESGFGPRPEAESGAGNTETVAAPASAATPSDETPRTADAKSG